MALGSGASVSLSSAWRGHWADITGYHGVGARTYDPVSGRWLSFDPAWNGMDPNGFTMSGGDPINSFDHDGRISRLDYLAGWNQITTSVSPAFGMPGYSVASTGWTVGDTYYVLAQGDPFYTGAQQIYSSSANSSSIVDTMLNTDARNYASQQWNDADWHSSWGITMKFASGISLTANTLDAGANMIPILGSVKSIAETAVKTVVKDVAKSFTEDVAKGELNIVKDEIPIINGRNPINSKYAGETYPVNRLSPDLQAKYPNSVEFNSQGFPDFSPYAKAEIEVPGLTGIRSTDEALANKAVGLSETPEGYTWHHVENGTTMQLVPSDIHGAVRHTGGAAIIQSN